MFPLDIPAREQEPSGNRQSPGSMDFRTPVRLDSGFRILLIILSPQQEEEVYFFRSDPRAFNIDLLLTVDESSYERESWIFASPLQMSDGACSP